LNVNNLAARVPWKMGLLQSLIHRTVYKSELTFRTRTCNANVITVNKYTVLNTAAISYGFEPRSRHGCLPEASLVHGELLKFVTP